MKVDFFFSYRSPYSYLVLPRMLKLKEEHTIDIQFKLVYPLAIRQPEFFKGKNFFSFFLHKTFDIKSKARKLNLPFYSPKPDPIQQSYITGKINKEQQKHKQNGIQFKNKINSFVLLSLNWKSVLNC